MKNIFEEIRFEQRKRAIKEKVSNGVRNGLMWFDRNKEALVVLTPIIVGGCTTIVKVVGKHNNLRKEERLKDLYCYDRSLGHYWALRRELSNKEWLEIERRKRNGEKLADILDDLRVLK